MLFQQAGTWCGRPDSGRSGCAPPGHACRLPKAAWMWASVMPKYAHCWLGQAKPSVFTCFGAPRRLFTSPQGRTGAEAGLTLGEGVQARRKAGQSSGVRGDAADGGACYVWPRLVRRKAEEGASKDARASPERAGGRPRAGTRTHEGPSSSSLLEIGSMESSLRSKDKESRECCQASGRAVRIIHHHESLDPGCIEASMREMRSCICPGGDQSGDPL